MTTLKKIISEIDFNNKSMETEPSWTELAQEFNLNLDWSNDTRLKCYFIRRWYCTDTYVGRKLYFFDDKLVAMSYQPGRKCDEKFYWTSQEDFKNVKQYLLSLLQPEDIDILDLSKNYGLGESIEYVEQLLTNKVIYQGLICNVINKNIQNNTICLAEVGGVSIHNIIVPYELNQHKEME